MTDRPEIVQQARQWIGTPYVHQASCQNAGTDCLGLVRGIWRSVVGEEPEQVPAYTRDWAEPAREEALLDAALRWLIPKPISSTDVGDVLVFRVMENRVAKHLGISAKIEMRSTFIHAYSGHSVVETSLSLPWARRIVGRFEYPAGVK